MLAVAALAAARMPAAAAALVALVAAQMPVAAALAAARMPAVVARFVALCSGPPRCVPSSTHGRRLPILRRARRRGAASARPPDAHQYGTGRAQSRSRPLPALGRELRLRGGRGDRGKNPTWARSLAETFAEQKRFHSRPQFRDDCRSAGAQKSAPGTTLSARRACAARSRARPKPRAPQPPGPPSRWCQIRFRKP